MGPGRGGCHPSSLLLCPSGGVGGLVGYWGGKRRTRPGRRKMKVLGLLSDACLLALCYEEESEKKGKYWNMSIGGWVDRRYIVVTHKNSSLKQSTV